MIIKPTSPGCYEVIYSEDDTTIIGYQAIDINTITYWSSIYFQFCNKPEQRVLKIKQILIINEDGTEYDPIEEERKERQFR